MAKLMYYVSLSRYITRSRRRSKIPPSLRVVVESTDEYRLIREGICPFCHRSFKRISIHLSIYKNKRGKCSMEYERYLNEVISIWETARRLIKERNKRNNNYFVDLVNTPRQNFKTVEEAIKFILQHINHSPKT